MAMSPKISSTTTLVAVLRFGELLGLRVGEMHGFSTVHNVHGKNSFHYDRDAGGKRWGHASDVNLIGHGANTSVERELLARLMHVARACGLAVTHAYKGTVGSAAGHQNHLHIDVGSWSNIGQGLIRASTVKSPVRESVRVDTGGVVLRGRKTPSLNGVIAARTPDKTRLTITDYRVANGILWGYSTNKLWYALVTTDGTRYVKVA
jgi:hypothetical protein